MAGPQLGCARRACLAPLLRQFIAPGPEVRQRKPVLPLGTVRVAWAEAQRPFGRLHGLVKTPVGVQRQGVGAEGDGQPVAFDPSGGVAQQRREVTLEQMLERNRLLSVVTVAIEPSQLR